MVHHAVPPQAAPEAITKAVASLPPEQMFELTRQMKVGDSTCNEILFVYTLTALCACTCRLKSFLSFIVHYSTP